MKVTKQKKLFDMARAAQSEKGFLTWRECVALYSTLYEGHHHLELATANALWRGGVKRIARNTWYAP